MNSRLFFVLIGVACLALASPKLHAQTGNGTVPTYCSGSVFYDTNLTGANVLLTATQSGGIYICGYLLDSPSSMTAALAYAPTGKSCVPFTQITPVFQLKTAQNAGSALINDTSPIFRGLYVPAGNDLCLDTGTAASLQVMVYFYQQRGN